MALCALVAVPGAVRAAQAPASQGSMHVAEQSALDAAVQQHVAQSDADRDTVRRFLQRDDVKAIAGKAGIDMRRADAAVAAMTPEEAASVAAQARQAEQGLAGGASTVTISTTAIIIGLLVLILLIVLLR
jgi:hypothetical protein